MSHNVAAAEDVLSAECKSVEAQLTLKNELFKNTIESIPHPFYVIDVSDYTIKIANSATTVFGDISENTTCYELTHKSKQPCRGVKHTCPLEEVKKTKRPVTTEHIHYDKNGNRRHFELHGYPIFDEAEDVVQMSIFSLDITERKRTEEALYKTHHELEARVKERTKELTTVNKSLRTEITEHKRAERELREYHQKLRSLASELTLTEERQRRRIATYLHDRIGQSLAVSKMRLSEIRKSMTITKLGKQLNEVCERIEQTIQDTRTLTFELSPPILYEIGFGKAVEWLTEQFQEHHGIQSHFKDDEKLQPLDNDILVVLFRAVRELLFNIAKHANAKSVTVSIERDDHNIRIQISDDGVGFDISKIGSQVEPVDGFGLFSIRERLDYLGGRMEIESKLKHGTRVTLLAPLIHDKEK